MYLSFSRFLLLCSLFFARSFSVPLLSLLFSFTLLSYPFSSLSLFLIAFPFFLSVFLPPSPSPLFPLFHLTVSSSSPSPLLTSPPPLFYPFPLLFPTYLLPFYLTSLFLSPILPPFPPLLPIPFLSSHSPSCSPFPFLSPSSSFSFLLTQVGLESEDPRGSMLFQKT